MTGLPPELAPGGPDDGDAGSVYGERRRRVIRWVVVIALAAMVLPLVLSLMSVAQSSAVNACRVTVARFDDEAVGARASFELFGPGGPGWLCYAERPSGGDRLLANLGLIPSAPHVLMPDERPA
ncbi:hypothetical protein GE115_13560 [Agromyces sp. CFH 90414]|uniref:Uncharacterized protein n=1 Tax=Agromyces agglutinans TaxID=2662258 RepID=A0A6I2FG47_9MICO|nr:hypothetical protein [Agromyces agglutinans]MRG60883.1 hypothetical protein [Agromyces agglutinans]